MKKYLPSMGEVVRVFLIMVAINFAAKKVPQINALIK